MLKYASTLISIIIVSASAHAQVEIDNDNPADSAFVILDAINIPDSKVEVIQSMELDRLVGRAEDQSLAGADNKESARDLGYRIQVFSDNNIRTAKSNAEYRKRQIESQMPEIRGYLTFDSPYWRVRVGDFRTQAEAASAMRSLKEAFPAFANDLRIVRVSLHL